MIRVSGCPQQYGLTPIRTVTTRLGREGWGEKKSHCRLGLSVRLVMPSAFHTLVFRTTLNHLVQLTWLISFFLICFSLSGISQGGPDPTGRIEPVYGAGSSTQLVKLFFKHFSKHPEAACTEFLVPERSTKHAGDIWASGQGGRTARIQREMASIGRKRRIFSPRRSPTDVRGYQVRS